MQEQHKSTYATLATSPPIAPLDFPN